MNLKKYTTKLAIIVIILCFINYTLANTWQDHFSFHTPKYSENFSHFDYVNPNAPKNGKITHAIIKEFTQFNLQTNYFPKNAIIFDTLMRESTDEMGSFYPLIAEQLLLDKDEKSVTFKINGQAKWSDESKINANDVFFSYNFFADNWTSFSEVKKVEIIDKQLIKFYFNTDSYKNIIAQIIQIPIIPQSFYHNKNFEVEFEKNNLPKFSGPYQIVDFQLGSFIKYQRNKNYWAQDLPVNKGRFNFDEITPRFYQDPKVAAFAMLNGEADLIVEYNNKNWQFAYPNVPQIKKDQETNLYPQKKILKQELEQKNVLRGARFFIFNNSEEIFQDLNFRKALNILFNFPKINQKVFNNSYTKLNTFFPGMDLNNKNAIQNLDSDEERIRQAFKLIKKTDFKIKDGKILDKNEKQIEISIVTFTPNHKIFIEPWLQNLQKIGLKVDVIITDAAQYYSRLKNGNYDVAQYEFRFNNIFDNSIWENLHSKGTYNFAGIKNSELDILLEKFTQEKDYQQKMYLLTKIDKILMENYYGVPQWTMDFLRIVFWNKLGRPLQKNINKIDYLQYGFDTWWVKKEQN